MSNLRRSRKPHAVPVRPADPPPGTDWLPNRSGRDIDFRIESAPLTLTADEARRLVAVLDATAKTAVSDPSDHDIRQFEIAWNALTAALVARLRDAGTPEAGR